MWSDKASRTRRKFRRVGDVCLLLMGAAGGYDLVGRDGDARIRGGGRRGLRLCLVGGGRLCSPLLKD